MFKNISLILVSLVTGFFVHALFFPDVLSNGIIFTPQSLLTQDVVPEPTNELRRLFTDITYDEKGFSRTNVTIKFADYITITNESEDKLMWLGSEEPLLATPRGYGYKEQVKARLDKREQIIVFDKNNPETKLIITVK